MHLDPDTACDLVLKIRRLHGKEIAEPDGADGSNDADDGMDDVLVEGLDAGNLAEIIGLLEGLESEQTEELIGLILLGREPDAYENLNAAKAAARDFSMPLVDFIESDPQSAEFLASGMEAAGIPCDAVRGGVALSPKDPRRVDRRV